MRDSLDESLLVCTEGFGKEQRVSTARVLLVQPSDTDLAILLQCLGELFLVLVDKVGCSITPRMSCSAGWMRLL